MAALSLKSTTTGGSTVFSTLSTVPFHEISRRVVCEREDNSSFAKAQPITAPAEIIGRCGGGDADYFSIQIAPEDVAGNAKPVLYIFDAASADWTVLEYTLELYDSSHNELALEYSANWANQAMVSYMFRTAGTYYIVRQGFHTYRMLVAVNKLVNP